MNNILQVILICCSIVFFLFIFHMVKIRKLELKYALTWILSSIIFVIIAIFPKIVSFIAEILFIKEPVNALFLIIMFFVIFIIFTLTIALSSVVNKCKTLTQELGILKMQLDNSENNERTDCH